MVLERVRKCPLVYPIVSAVYIPYVRSLYPIGDAPGAPHPPRTPGYRIYYIGSM